MIDKGEKLFSISLSKSLMKYVYVSLWTPHRILVTVYSDFDRGVSSVMEFETQLLEITYKNLSDSCFITIILIFKLCI